MVRRRTRGAALVVVAALGVAVGGCSGDEVAAFCDDLETLHDAGPLFPARTDGEPVANPEVAQMLRSVAATAPADIAEELSILAEEAEALVEASRRRRSEGSSFSPDGRLSRSVVEAAQRAVFRYAASTCDIDLTQATVPAGESEVEDPSEVLPSD